MNQQGNQKAYLYTWKPDWFSSRIAMETNKPVFVGYTVVDLCSGDRSYVSAVEPAQPGDRETATLPETVVHTRPMGRATPEQLTELRARDGRDPIEFMSPLQSIVFDF